MERNEEPRQAERWHEGGKPAPPPAVKPAKVEYVNGITYADGYVMNPGMRPLQCRKCGAIWQKESVTLATADPRCRTCQHLVRDLVEVEAIGE